MEAVRDSHIYICAGPSKLKYVVNCDAGWQTQSARVSGVAAGTEMDLSFSVAEGRWLLNTVACAAIQGCVDIDFDLHAGYKFDSGPTACSSDWCRRGGPRSLVQALLNGIKASCPKLSA